MNPVLRLLLPLGAIVGAAALPAQCLAIGGGTKVTSWVQQTYNYTGISAAHVPLGFAFPMAGAARPSFTHMRIGAKGWLLLTDGVASTGMPAVNGLASAANDATGIGGAVGDFPLVAPWWANLQWYSLASDGVFVDSVPGVSCKVSWVNVRDVGSVTNYGFAVELFANGEVRFHYDSAVENRTPFGNVNFAGVSARNGITPTLVDWYPQPALTTNGIAYASYAPNSFDFMGGRVTFTPIGTGWTTTVCGGAQHVASGAGCYASEAGGIYQYFPNAASASAALQGNVLRLRRTARGYATQWSQGTAWTEWLPPTAATGPTMVLTPNDDGYFPIGLPAPFPLPGNTPPESYVWVANNGIVTLGLGSNQGSDFTPSPSEFLNAPLAAFYAWHDYNPAEPGSSPVVTYPVGNRYCFTWDFVENRPYGIPNPSQFQIVFDLATGDVQFTWLLVDANSTSSFGSQHLIGVKGQGPIVDPGSTSLSAPGLQCDFRRQLPMQLSAVPAPVYGTTCNYTTANVPEFVPGSGVHVLLQVLSLGSTPGVDLGFLGAPGCSSYVPSLDVTFAAIGASSTVSVPYTLPPSGPYGFPIFAQSVALGAPGVFFNTAGLQTSNLLTSTLRPF